GRTRSLHIAAPSAHVFGPRLWRFIAPRMQRPIAASQSGALPFRFSRQTITPTRDSAQPLAIRYGFEPVHRYHRLVRMIEVRIGPLRRRGPAGGFEKASEIPITDLENGHLER